MNEMSSDRVSVPVPENINAALGQLHLEELEQEVGEGERENVAEGGEGKDSAGKTSGGQAYRPPAGFMEETGNGMVPGHGPGHAGAMFAPHMMNPFIAYHPMMHMPHSGFSPADSSAAVDFIPGQAGMDLGLAGADVTNEARLQAQAQAQALGPGQMPMFWINPESNASAIDDAHGVADPLVRGSSFAVDASESSDIPVPGANTSRRQTFHAVTATDLLDETATQQSSGANAASFEVLSDGAKKDGQERMFTHNAAYPYSGALLQPNPVISGHHLGHPIGSPFPGFGFNSPFSPVPGTPLGNSIVPGSVAAAGMEGENSDAVIGNAQNLQHGSTPPGMNQTGHPITGTWMFAAPHGSPNFLMPHHPGHPASHQRPPSNGGQNRKRHFNGPGSGQYNRSFNGKPHGKTHRYEDASRYQDAVLDQFVGSIYSLCTDQHGCRFLQRQLDEFGEEAASKIYSEIRDHICELMNDPFGNYLMQKLFERIDQKDRIEIVRNCSPRFLDIALDAHGTRALQKLVECIDTEEEITLLVSSLKPSIVALSRDFKSNHVVQKMLEKFSSKDTQFIYDAACEDIIKIGNHRNGCCVVQRCLDFGTVEQRDSLCGRIVSKSFELTMNPYGNYVIQYILTKEKEDGNFKYTEKIVHVLKANAVELSMNKFGSNVIESILRTPKVSDIIITELLNSSDEFGLSKLLHDSYGNYVLQTALDIVKESNKVLFGLLSDSLKPLLVGQIRNTPHGRRISALLQLDSNGS